MIRWQQSNAPICLLHATTLNGNRNCSHSYTKSVLPEPLAGMVHARWQPRANGAWRAAHVHAIRSHAHEATFQRTVSLSTSLLEALVLA